MNQHYLQLYADFIVKVGVNVRPRQNFIVRCPVTMPDFAHAFVRAAMIDGIGDRLAAVKRSFAIVRPHSSALLNTLVPLWLIGWIVVMGAMVPFWLSIAALRHLPPTTAGLVATAAPAQAATPRRSATMETVIF